LATVPAISHASFLPFLSALVKTGIKAEEKVPKTKTSKIRSGSLKAAKKRESSLGAKKWAKVRCLTSPKTREATTINMIIVAAERTEDWGETKNFLPRDINFPTIVY
jgi:hypothetical protein